MDTNDQLFADAKALLDAGRAPESERVFRAAIEAAEGPAKAPLASKAGRLAHKAGKAEMASRLYGLAQQHDPANAEHPHDRGLALLEAGYVGLAAQAQGEALAVDPSHVGARAQRAGALEAMGDDEGAVRELDKLLSMLGPNPTFHMRREAARERAKVSGRQRLVGAPNARLRASHTVGAVFVGEAAAHGSLALRSHFASLTAALDPAGRISELRLVFDDMDASLQRADLAYGGTTEDEHGRRVPLDEFTATALLFVSESLGLEPDRARRILRWLLTAEAGRGPHRLAGAEVTWLVLEDDGKRRYGLSVAPAPELV